MSNVLSDLQQVLALGRLGWSLRRIQAATGIRRETADEHPELHEQAFRRLGGTVRVIVLDNLKEGVRDIFPIP